MINRVKAEFAGRIPHLPATKFNLVRQPFVITVKYILKGMVLGTLRMTKITPNVYESWSGSLE
jgi:hypothetical protein